VGAALQQPLVAVCRCCAPANTGLLCCGPPLAVRNSAAWRWQRLRRGHRHQQLATATPSPTASAAQQRAAQRTAVTPKARQQCSWPSQLGHAKGGRADALPTSALGIDRAPCQPPPPLSSWRPPIVSGKLRPESRREQTCSQPSLPPCSTRVAKLRGGWGCGRWASSPLRALGASDSGQSVAAQLEGSCGAATGRSSKGMCIGRGGV
jgi:hypothetical protein